MNEKKPQSFAEMAQQLPPANIDQEEDLRALDRLNRGIDKGYSKDNNIINNPTES